MNNQALCEALACEEGKMPSGSSREDDWLAWLILYVSRELKLITQVQAETVPGMFEKERSYPQEQSGEGNLHEAISVSDVKVALNIQTYF